jgi:hypothetical protein
MKGSQPIVAQVPDPPSLTVQICEQHCDTKPQGPPRGMHGGGPPSVVELPPSEPVGPWQIPAMHENPQQSALVVHAPPLLMQPEHCSSTPPSARFLGAQMREQHWSAIEQD